MQSRRKTTRVISFSVLTRKSSINASRLITGSRLSNLSIIMKN
ncbi:hypothetical protein LINPERHAP1_LOCUS10829 [Linum perenne]